MSSLKQIDAELDLCATPVCQTTILGVALVTSVGLPTLDSKSQFRVAFGRAIETSSFL